MSADPEDIHSIDRREARSGRVSYSEPVVLHDSTRQRVVFVPFYVPRSEGTELAIKIQTYRKAPPLMDWVLAEDKSISLQEAAARRLSKALKEHFAVAQTESDGSYLVIRVSEGTAQLGEHDPAAVAAALTKVLSQREIVSHLADTELSQEFMQAFRGAIRLKEMRDAVAELRQHLDSGEKSESVYRNGVNNIVGPSVMRTWCATKSGTFRLLISLTCCFQRLFPATGILSS